MAAEWLTSHRASKRPRQLSSSETSSFANDWGTYENVSSHGSGTGLGAGGTGGPPLPGTSHRTVRKPSALGLASSVRLPFSPKGTTHPHPIALDPFRSRDRDRCGATGGGVTLDPHVFPSTLSNPEPTVRLSEDDAPGLSPEQRVAVESILSGYSTFFTGPAGSGKSHVLNSLVRLNEEVRLNRRAAIDKRL